MRAIEFRPGLRFDSDPEPRTACSRARLAADAPKCADHYVHIMRAMIVMCMDVSSGCARPSLRCVPRACRVEDGWMEVRQEGLNARRGGSGWIEAGSNIARHKYGSTVDAFVDQLFIQHNSTSCYILIHNIDRNKNVLTTLENSNQNSSRSMMFSTIIVER